MLLDTSICQFGWKAPDFTLKEPDGTSYTMSQELGQKGLLVAFICNHCPYVRMIANRFSNDMKTLQADDINVLAVMSNDYQFIPTDNPENMKLFANQH